MTGGARKNCAESGACGHTEKIGVDGNLGWGGKSLTYRSARGPDGRRAARFWEGGKD